MFNVEVSVDPKPVPGKYIENYSVAHCLACIVCAPLACAESAPFCVDQSPIAFVRILTFCSSFVNKPSYSIMVSLKVAGILKYLS